MVGLILKLLSMVASTTGHVHAVFADRQLELSMAGRSGRATGVHAGGHVSHGCKAAWVAVGGVLGWGYTGAKQTPSHHSEATDSCAPAGTGHGHGYLGPSHLALSA
jgi:hypothetical protein